MALNLLGAIRLSEPTRWSNSSRLLTAVLCGMCGALAVSFVAAGLMLLATGRFDLTHPLVVIERATALSVGLRSTVMLTALAGAGPAAWLGCIWFYHGLRVQYLRGTLLCGATAAFTWFGMILSATSMRFVLPGVTEAAVGISSMALGVYGAVAGPPSSMRARWRWTARVLWVAAIAAVVWCGQWYLGYTSIIQVARARELVQAKTRGARADEWWQVVHADYQLDDVDHMLTDARAATHYLPADDYAKLLLGETLLYAHHRSKGIQVIDATIDDLRREAALPHRAILLAQAKHALQQAGASVPER